MPISIPPNYHTWVAQFEKSTLGRVALRLLENAFPATKKSDLARQFYPLRDIVLESCYGAAMFQRTGEPGDRRLHADKAALNALKPSKKRKSPIAALQVFVKNHRNAARMAFFGVILDLRSEGIDIRRPDSNDRDPVLILERILAVLESRLSRAIPFIASGNLLDRFVYGCLLYDAPLDRPNSTSRPGPQKMLAFHLVQIFRLRSKGLPPPGLGQTMPKSSGSHYAVAAAFLDATFPDPRKHEPTTGAEVDDGLKRLREETLSAKEKRSRKGERPKGGKRMLGYYPWPVFRT